MSTRIMRTRQPSRLLEIAHAAVGSDRKRKEICQLGFLPLNGSRRKSEKQETLACSENPDSVPQKSPAIR